MVVAVEVCFGDDGGGRLLAIVNLKIDSSGSVQCPVAGGCPGSPQWQRQPGKVKALEHLRWARPESASGLRGAKKIAAHRGRDG